jgi:hypothetical protein
LGDAAEPLVDTKGFRGGELSGPRAVLVNAFALTAIVTWLGVAFLEPST